MREDNQGRCWKEPQHCSQGLPSLALSRPPWALSDSSHTPRSEMGEGALPLGPHPTAELHEYGGNRLLCTAESNGPWTRGPSWGLQLACETANTSAQRV